MGFDISYHPIRKEEIKILYFDVLKDISLIQKNGGKFKIEDFYLKKYRGIIEAGKKTTTNHYFEKTHGYHIANIQGLFRMYFYTRGSAYSFLIEDKKYFQDYTTDLKVLFPNSFDTPISNKISENYSSGVYIDTEQVIQLLNDYKTVEKVKNDLNNYYSHNRIDIFLKALKYAKENNLGLLEASEVVEPNPFDVPKSISYSNLFNCDKEGVYLYIDAAEKQIKEIEKANNIKRGKVSSNKKSINKTANKVEKNVKKGFWKKLFKK